MPSKPQGMLLILSGPSGVGKGTLVARLLEEDKSFCLSCSATTREPREGEIDGVHYHFLTNEQYDELLARDAFLEHAEVHGNRYGTLKSCVEECQKQGKNIVLDIDCQGACHVMSKTDDYVSVFILPPSMAVLHKRLEERGTETPETIAKRTANARGEMEKISAYQYAVINDDFEEAFHTLTAIITAEKHRLTRYNPTIPD